MTTSDIVDGIIRKKKEIGMTSQQLSDASKVPKSTIDRILRGDTPNPSLQTVLDLAAAVGYSLSNHPEQPEAAPSANVKDPMVSHLIAVYENRGRAYEERIKRITAHFNMLLAEKNRWLKFSLTLNLIFVLFFAIVILVDVTNSDIGWVREMFSHSGAARYFGDRLMTWVSGLFI